MNALTLHTDYENNSEEVIVDAIFSIESCFNNVDNMKHKYGSISVEISGDIKGIYTDNDWSDNFCEYDIDYQLHGFVFHSIENWTM